MNEEKMRKDYEVTPKEILINILISARKEFDKLQNRNKEYKQEIERLNNIINELERLLNNQIENYKDSECEELQAMVQEDKSILFILKELKGSDKE